MKRIICTIILALCAVFAMGQTPAEILSRMNKEMQKHQDDGLYMVMDVRVPLIGKMTMKVYSLGDKSREEARILGHIIITWREGATEWEYDSADNELTIKTLEKVKKSKSDGSMKVLGKTDSGYDFKIVEETDTEWLLRGKRNDENEDEDSPKNIDIRVAKGSYLPLGFSVKMSGTKMNLRDITYGVTESQVTFNPADYPDAKIVDKR